MEPKPIPLITWGNMAPPFTDHLYFQYREHVPFQAQAQPFNPVNAWWLSEAALLAYTQEEFAIPCFEAAGFQEIYFFSVHATQCYLAANDKFAVVAFRGTECGIQRGPEALAQFFTDLNVDIDIRWVKARGGGKIHRGFDTALDHIWPELGPVIQRISGRGCPLWFTGHSLGGALAVLAAFRHKRAQGIYTFGAPRVGNQSFTSQFPVTAHRFVNNNDVIAHLPTFPYADLGELHYIDSNGDMHDRIDWWQRIKDEIQGHIHCIAENVRNLDRGLTATLPDGLKDHTPLLYALHLWNHLVTLDQ